MPWPDFTELTFGSAFLREFEKNYVNGGRFPKAPDFISQGAEATKGYDVEIAMSDATPVYLQLKRSYVLVTCNAKEIKGGIFTTPKVYRMGSQSTRVATHGGLKPIVATFPMAFVVAHLEANPSFIL
jgi:hypothetical protein